MTNANGKTVTTVLLMMPCHFCILNGSYVSCVQTDSDFYSREKGACQVDLILNVTCSYYR